LTKPTPTIFALGLNHETASLELREKVAFDASNLSDSLDKFHSAQSFSEALILSTCNRMELYFSGLNPEDALNYLSENFNVKREVLDPHIYIFTDREALEHASRVASGLNSMVIGETQILGQMKDAYRVAHSAGYLGLNLHKFFSLVFSIAKQVRNETLIGANSVSLAAASLKVLKTIFPDPNQRKVLFVGAGEMIRLCAQHFLTSAFHGVGFINRSIDKADELATLHNGDAYPLEVLPDMLHRYDVIVSCTGSQVPILGKGSFERALQRRKHYPMVIFDLAVPRDVEPEVESLDDIFLYSIDALGDIVKSGYERRGGAAVEAERIVSLRAREFLHWKSARASAGSVKLFREFGENLIEREYERALHNLQQGADPEAVLQTMSRSMKNKFLDRPSRVLSAGDTESREALATALLRLFNLIDTK